MGTDITAYMEQKQDNGIWECIGKIHLYQNYNMFALLDGTRDYYKVKPIIFNRPYSDLPNDISKYIENKIPNMYDFSEAMCLTKEDVENYTDWDTLFYDTREKKNITPNEQLKLNPLFKEMYDELRTSSEKNPKRVIFWYDW